MASKKKEKQLREFYRILFQSRFGGMELLSPSRYELVQLKRYSNYEGVHIYKPLTGESSSFMDKRSKLGESNTEVLLDHFNQGVLVGDLVGVTDKKGGYQDWCYDRDYYYKAVCHVSLVPYLVESLTIFPIVDD